MQTIRQAAVYPASPVALAGRSLVSIHDLDREEIELILREADCYRKLLERGQRLQPLAGHVLATFFFEPSTRTRLSFESAMHRLGGAVISTPDGGQASSAVKGESIADTIKTLVSYADIIVQRHPAIGSAQAAACAAAKSGIPVINAGDGAGEHPTQALLDLYTIQRERGTLDGLKVTLVGDLKHGRTVHSLLKALCLWDIHVTLVAPDGLQMPAALVAELTAQGAAIDQTNDLQAGTDEADVVYMTRIQKERFACPADYEAVRGSFVIDVPFMRRNRHITLMHPLPRVDEISADVDDLPNAAYFRQAQNGLYVRMALLALVLGEKPLSTPNLHVCRG